MCLRALSHPAVHAILNMSLDCGRIFLKSVKVYCLDLTTDDSCYIQCFPG